MKVRVIENGTHLAFHCPGCGENKSIAIAGPGVPSPSWRWNGDLERPTLTPSILSKGHRFKSKDSDETEPFVCHSFVTDGQIQFLGDCTHALAGQTVALEDFNP